MILRFAWRYFKGKKSANAINIIAWVTTGVIAFATCCQILVLSVFNGFEGLVKSLYGTFYADIRVLPSKGKIFEMDAASIKKLQRFPMVKFVSMIVEEKALLQNGDYQSTVILKGVDKNYTSVTGVSQKIREGEFDLGDIDHPKIVMGTGIQNAAGIIMNEAFPPEPVTVILPKYRVVSNDLLESLSEGNVTTSGIFAIQQDFDNQYAIAGIDFMKQQMALSPDQYNSVEIKLVPGIKLEEAQTQLQQLLGEKFQVQTRYQQNMSLYTTMRMEKWAIYAVLTLILIIAAFNMISSLTMLVLEKRKDIFVLQSMGADKSLVRRIFLSEGLILGIAGAGIGITVAAIICLLQLKFQIIKLKGGSFLIDYFPVKMYATDFILVSGGALLIALLAAWFPAHKAAQQQQILSD